MLRGRILISCLVLLSTPSSSLFAHIRLETGTGGEVLAADSAFTIRWSILVAHDLLNWDIQYSTTGPDGPWHPVATDLPPGDPRPGSVHTYLWTVPATYTDQARLRVIMDNEDTEDLAAGSPYNFFIIAGPRSEPTFTRGDCDTDGTIGLPDALVILEYLFLSAPAPSCLVACDVDDTETITLTDAFHTLSYRFAGGAWPIAPFPGCGWDPTPDGDLLCTQPTSGCP